MKSPASKPSHCFGSHLSVAGGMYHAIEAAHALNFQTVQVFVKNQRQWQAPPLTPETITAWLTARDAAPIGPIVAHASYLINLGSTDEVLFKRSRDAFADELSRCDQLEIPYLVIHPGAAGEAPVPEALGRVAQALNEIFVKHPALRTMALLELTAGQGTTLGRSVEELGAIIAGVKEPARIGVCIDTCHAFAAGYDIRDPRIYAEMMAAADQSFGLSRIRCWHLNDSKGKLASHLDRHEHVGRGEIGDAGFANVLRDPRFIGVPMILETPKEDDDHGVPWDTVNLNRLRAIATPRRGH